MRISSAAVEIVAIPGHIHLFLIFHVEIYEDIICCSCDCGNSWSYSLVLDISCGNLVGNIICCSCDCGNSWSFSLVLDNSCGNL